MQPEVIIFDEATSMLDPSGRREVLEVMGELHRGGTTIIHITHSPREASRAERVLVLAGANRNGTGLPLSCSVNGSGWLTGPLKCRLQRN